MANPGEVVCLTGCSGTQKNESKDPPVLSLFPKNKEDPGARVVAAANSPRW